MKYRIPRIAAVLCLLCCLLTGTALAANKYTLQADGYEIIMDQTDWDSFDHTHSAYQTPEEFLNYVKEGADKIAAFVGRPDWINQHVEKQLQVSVSATRSHSKRYGLPTILLERNWLTYDMGPVYHELAHLICPNNSSRSLSEGLCTYLHNQLGGPATVFNFGQNHHAITQDLIRSNPKAADMMTTIGSLQPYSKYAESGLRASYYTASYSYTDYVISTYGLDKFMALYAARSNDDYPAILGKSYEEIHRDWLVFLETNHAAGASVEDYAAAFSAKMIEYGMPDEMAQMAAAGIGSMLSP